jgi:hypothetical protein
MIAEIEQEEVECCVGLKVWKLDHVEKSELI